MANPTHKGRIKSSHSSGSGVLKPLEGNFRDVKYTKNDFDVGLGDFVLFRKKRDGTAEILKVTRRAK